MPFKWKLYYFAAICMIISGLSIAGFAIFGSAEDHFSSKDDLIYGGSILLIGVIVILKAVYSIKAIARYKNYSLLTKPERTIFIISFILNAVITTLACILIIVAVIPTLYRQFTRPVDYYRNSFWLTSWQMIIIAFAILATICSAYACICDLIFLRSIRKRHYAMLEEIGKEIVETN